MWYKLYKPNRKLRRWLTGSSGSLNTTHMQIHYIVTKVLHSRPKDRHSIASGRGRVNGLFFSGFSECSEIIIFWLKQKNLKYGKQNLSLSLSVC